MIITEEVICGLSIGIMVDHDLVSII